MFLKDSDRRKRDMKKDKDKYELPKTRVVGPIIAYTLIFLLTLGTIVAVISILADYVFNVRSEAEKRDVKEIAQAYNESSEEGRIEILNVLIKQNKQFALIDSSGKILISNGEITCEGYDKKNRTISTKVMSEFYEDINEKVEKALESEYGEEVDEDVREAVRQNLLRFNNLITLSQIDDTSYDSGSFIYIIEAGLDHIDDFYEDSDYYIEVPFWEGVIVDEGSGVLLMRIAPHITGSDYFYLMAGAIVAGTIALILFVLMIANVVGNLSNSKKMKKLMFRDNIAKGRNWLWFVVNSRELLLKRRHSSKTYAIVELVFIKYRNFVLCHSVKEAEELLSKVASVVTSKLGKDEFCAHSTSSALPILMEVKDEEDARRRLQDIISELEKIPCGHKLAFRAGVYLVTPSKEKPFTADIDLMYNNACSAGLSIADSNDSGIAFFDDKLVEEEKWIDKVGEKQQGAIDKEEFLVYYQPKYDPRTNELMGAEALIRWNMDGEGLVPPGRFIPIFEDNGFITNIDHYMVTHVARDQKKWLDEGRKCVPVSVNISRAHFSESDLADQICGMVDKEGTPHELIEIELTESAFFDDKDAMLNTINALKSHGFLVSMDDFGSGYSSLNSLKDMPLDILKLDAGFFRGKNEDNSRTEKVVSEAIKLAKALNMKTVAEGVEEKAQVDFLATEGCDMIQGYYYAKPMPKDEFENRIDKAEVSETEPAPVEPSEPAEPTE